jgi:hypothetical protein
MLAGAAHAQAPVASGIHWRMTIERIDCEAPGLISVATHIRYLGPKGPVEAPLAYLTDGRGRQFLPRSLVWKRGTRQVADWLSAGGVANLQLQDIGEVALKFSVPDAVEVLRLEFGDVPAFALTGAKGALCQRLLGPGRMTPPRRSRAAPAKASVRVYRSAYPCREKNGALRTVEADQPPYSPRQVLVFGRGFLPSARHVQLPTGSAPAQPYAYAGPDELSAIEEAARRAILADFPRYAARQYFAFNWGEQRAKNGNQVDSVGLYELQACPP